MTLQDYILTYQGVTDLGTEGYVCNIPDYYERYIKPLDKKFAEYSFYGSNLVICCFHDDHDPSLGLIKPKYLNGVSMYHCFGCGIIGTVIRMHQYIQEVYHNRVITEIEASQELAVLFNIPLDDFDALAEDDFEGRYIRTLKSIAKMQKAYTLKDYSLGILKIRKDTGLSASDRLRLVNVESIKMIATQKCLYS